ncbi:hypothetical protein EVAR_190_1 [Eumeta japonica]|uniref:Uncharacterized protein n=1 Tax=Eumeta variegata TaxID=151549 RepID=A0A4C1S9W0_EUMVA|nr:hypothetical protein EVAR_190_1 [Eumeta japonica]
MARDFNWYLLMNLHPVALFSPGSMSSDDLREGQPATAVIETDIDTEYAVAHNIVIYFGRGRCRDRERDQKRDLLQSRSGSRPRTGPEA